MMRKGVAMQRSGKMKRSAKVSLLGSGLSLLVLGGCQDTTPVAAHVYESIEACTQAGELSASQCQRGFEVAIDVHEEAAPTFDSLAVCETGSGVGKCEVAPSEPGGSERRYRPAMQAFLIASGGYGQTQPLYKTGDGLRTASNYQMAAASGAVSMPREAMARPAPRAASVTAVARGGFGSSGARVAAVSGHASGG
jgi:uncharacterized protein YgiB involved in biofilm formation